jgi:malonyl-CoA/methylmalonyl-CoA synthetase
VREKGGTLEERMVLQGLRDRLARYKQPKAVVFVDELPRNAMGKVQKNVLRERYGKMFEAAFAATSN